MMGCEVLPPMLAEFSLRFPKIHLEPTLSDRNLDLLRRDAHIAVRMVHPTQTALVARRVGVISIGLFAHRRYVEAFGLPKGSEEIWILLDWISSRYRPHQFGEWTAV